MSGEQTPNILNMSDEELLNFDPTTLPEDDDSDNGGEGGEGGAPASPEPPTDPAEGGEAPDGEAGEGAQPSEGEKENDPNAEDTDDDSAPEGAGEGTSGSDSGAGNADESGDDTNNGDAADAADKAEADESGNEDGEDKEADTDQPVTAEEFYKRITAPFKANGKEIQVDNPDDAVRLMQMGANYSKKMAALKPSLKTLKLLENNELLDEQKLSFLIDLNKGDKGAIAKLIKDSGIDPMDLDQDGESTYKPTEYTVDDREMAFDSVIDEIRDTETYGRTIDVVSSKWDDASKQTVANTPEVLKVINDHMASGVYDVISSELDKQRMLGKLSGLSDIEAYRQVGDEIQARGGFNHLFQDKQESGQPASQPKTPASPKPKATDPKLKDKRRAASPPKAAASSKGAPKDFNPLSLSDEEFEKQTLNKYL